MLTPTPRSSPLVVAILLCGCTGTKATTDGGATGDDDDSTQDAPTCGPECHSSTTTLEESGDTGTE